MKKFLSVIVPVYNVEIYLQKCLDSIIDQSFKNLEIIIVNDGSTDSSPEICDCYAKKDSRIKVIHQKNAGVSVARNKGMQVATGDYLTFVDSDDWLELNMYETMIATFQDENPSDVFMCDFIKVKIGSNEEISSTLRSGSYSKLQIISELYPTLIVTEKFGRIPIISVWSCMFRSSFLKNNNIRFDASLMYSEDYLFMAEVMTKATSFFYLKEKYLYNYLFYEESRSKKYQPDWWQNLLHLHSELKKLLKDNVEYDFSRQTELQLIHSVFFVLNSIQKNDFMTVKNKVQEINKILSSKELVDVFSSFSLKKHQKTLKLVLYLLKYRMAYGFLIFQRILSSLKNV